MAIRAGHRSEKGRTLTLVTDDDVERYVSFDAIMAAVEKAFIALDRGESEVFDVVRGRGGGAHHFFAIKSARDASIPALGLKVGSYVPDNLERGLRAHSSMTILVDDVTGIPHAVIEANYLNGMRTAAADALAVRMLARADSSTLGIIGIGDQAIWEVIAVARVRAIKRLLAVGGSTSRKEKFTRAIEEQLDLSPEFVDAEEAARKSDILITATPARSPVIEAEWVRQGTHISAMGADDSGKQELPVNLLRTADVWVDHVQQALQIGEMQHLYAAGLVSEAALQLKTLGRLLVLGSGFSREADSITVFDSSGLAIQDLAAAHAALKIVLTARE